MAIEKRLSVCIDCFQIDLTVIPGGNFPGKKKAALWHRGRASAIEQPTGRGIVFPGHQPQVQVEQLE